MDKPKTTYQFVAAPIPPEKLRASAFTLYMTDFMKKAQAQNPKGSKSLILKRGLTGWKLLGEAEKARFAAEAEENNAARGLQQDITAAIIPPKKIYATEFTCYLRDFVKKARAQDPEENIAFVCYHAFSQWERMGEAEKALFVPEAESINAAGAEEESRGNECDSIDVEEVRCLTAEEESSRKKRALPLSVEEESRGKERGKKRALPLTASETVRSGENLVGAKIKVWWPLEHSFFSGVIDSFDPESKTHKVLYDDGDVEDLSLQKRQWEFVEGETLLNEEQVTEDPIDASSKTYVSIFIGCAPFNFDITAPNL